MTILIVSDIAHDAHLAPVASALNQRGHNVRIFNPGLLPSSATVMVDDTPAGPRQVIHWEGRTLDLSEVRSVWYRRPGSFDISDELAEGEQEWLRRECRDLIQGIWASLDAFWISEPHRIEYANSKLLQLKLARQLGFRIPAYTVTNSPERAREFVAAFQHGVAVKALGYPTINLADAGGMMYTHRVTQEDMALIESVKYGPTFFQEFVQKRFDIRVTVFGDRVFAVAIDSTGTPESRDDFRDAQIFDLPHHPLELPENVNNACIDLVDRLGLEFGAIDLLLTPDGEYVFLEINPNGQWYWIEMMTDLPMTNALCDLLERGGGLEATVHRSAGIPVPTPSADGDQSSPTFQLGTHTIPLPSTYHAQSGANPASSDMPTIATNAWMEEKSGTILLHIGDVEDNDRR